MTKLNLAIVITGISLWTTALHAQTINVCRGEFADERNKCLSYEYFAPCEPPLEPQIRELCKKLGAEGEDPKFAPLRTVEGNFCGYTNYRVVCQ